MITLIKRLFSKKNRVSIENLFENKKVEVLQMGGNYCSDVC